jgi:hypothetical protein
MYYSENCRVSDHGIQQIIKMESLIDLRLGNPMRKANGERNTFTVGEFEAVLLAI